MHRYLEEILARRRARIREESAREPAGGLLLGPPPPNPVPAIRGSGGFLIAEFKRASPSKGCLANGAELLERVRSFERGGADAVSILCEPDFFGGSREDLRDAASVLGVPVLCKDFVVDEIQLKQARMDGARWVLLIARILGRDQLDELVSRALAIGLEPLVEVHSHGEMRAAVESGARIIGVNARDLETFEIDLDRVTRLLSECPTSCACIAESGLRSAADLIRLRDAGAHGFLIGEALMRSVDPAALLREFKGVLLGTPQAVVPR